MNIRKTRRTAPVNDPQPQPTPHIPAQPASIANGKSGKLVANPKPRGTGKTSPAFWAPRLFNPKNDDGLISANYAMRVQFKGKRTTFTTNTPNKEAAARIAAGIYSSLITEGWDATIAKHRPTAAHEEGLEEQQPVATVGKWIEAARKFSQTKAATFHSYETALRKIAGDVLAVKRSDKRFGPKSGGARKYREKVDAAGLDILSQGAVQQWRLDYVAGARNPKKRASRMTSCNSTVRMARSLFAPKIVKFIPELRLPVPPPFEGVEFFPRQNAKYFSVIDPRALLQKAREELAETKPAAFLAMLLAIAAGLRRAEIDSLCWGQVDFGRQLIRVDVTEQGGLKSQDSRGEVPIDENVAAVLKGAFSKLKSRDAAKAFVIPGGGAEGGHKRWGMKYRADGVFRDLTDWLRRQGVTARKPLHELRKEFGALVTAEHGIYAASRVLRHADVSTTARHYSDLKTRPVVNVGAWLLPENVDSVEPRTES